MARVRACPRCGEDPPEGARFCTRCGQRLGPAPEPTAVVADPDAPRLVECGECGAGNAASRPICARCGTPLRDEVPGGDALPESAFDPPDTAPGPAAGRDGPGLVLALVILGALITAGVLLALVTSRVRTPGADVVPRGVALQAAAASSALEDHPASLAIDGDPATAWTESAQGPGVDEWLDITLASEVAVRRLLLWNGDQTSEQHFAENGRAAAVRIDVGDRQFRVALEDAMGAQAIRLPEPVDADRIRIVVTEAIPGDRYADLALSEVVVEAGG
ncbi:discoidin domain-containing protein [Euzebya sp.]|uniref:NADase-type glycan-binding domain-containing protein n=1 Tax=Euzebya sp. TaxID=1971409 RepID=UPI0035165B49